MRSGFHMALGGAQEYYGVTPDMATFSKALSNGYALSVLAGRRELMQGLAQTYVSSTFFTNSLAMAAALACVQKLRREQVIAHLWRTGQALMEGLDHLAQELGIEAHSIGVAPMPFLAFRYADAEVRETAKYVFYRETTRRGVLLHPSHHWFVCAAHTEADVAHTLEVAEDGFRAVKEALGHGFRAPSVQRVAVTVNN